MNDVGSSQKLPLPETPPPGYTGAPDDATVISAPNTGLTPGINTVAPVELGRLLAGETLDHFELAEYVGGGGMGAVFRARDTLLNREVAVKVLARGQGSDAETTRRFRNEAQSAARLDHENIARVYFVGEDRGLNYIVFEFIEGVNLRQRVEERGGPLPVEEAVNYTIQIARALDHASRRDVVHRDIKPSNVLITAEGKAKLVDMGLARLHQVDASGMDLTASGVTLGTFDYISPEQARDPRSADVRSDLYSLGCTLFFVLTARPPFPEGTVLQKLLQHNSDEAPDPAEFNPTIPPELSTIVAKLLAKNPRHRYQTPADLIDDLLVVAERLGMHGIQWSPAAPRVKSRSFVERHLPWLAPIGVLVAIVLGLSLAGHGPGAGDDPPPVESFSIPATPDASDSTAASKSADSTASAAASLTPSPGEAFSTATVVSALTPTAETPRDGLLIVSPTADGPRQYTSLRAACSEAKSGDVIELRYNGPREERPITLSNIKLTIRAADKFRPVVVFRPDDSDPLAYPRSMISVVGGRLTMFDLALELDVPSPWDIAAENWTFLAAERCEGIDVHSSVLTIRNHGKMPGATHRDVAFFDVTTPRGFDMMAEDTGAAREPVSIQLENSIVRGEAVLARVADRGSIDVTWNSGLFIGDGYLLSVFGTEEQPRPDDRLRVSLRHLTAIVAGGLIEQLADYPWPHPLPIEVTCEDSILMSPSGGSLIVQRGPTREAFQQQLTWHGERNFYEGFSPDEFWRIDDTGQFAQPQFLDFQSWIAEQNERLPELNSVKWKALPSADSPLAERTGRDYALDDQASDNAALQSASDGRDAGMSLIDLPRPPGS